LRVLSHLNDAMKPKAPEIIATIPKTQNGIGKGINGIIKIM
jgi:hypothetical protein